MGKTAMMISLPNSQNITRVVLSNGITILVYENPHAHSVVLSGMMHGGAIHETPAQNGLASMTATALMRGTHTRDFDTIHSTLEDIGADLGVGSGTHHVSFGGKALAEDLPVLVELLNDVLRNPSFPERQIERLRGERLTWLKYQEQDTRRQAARAFRENLYPQHHPYHYSPRGTLATIPELSVDDIRGFHAQHYGPEGFTIGVVGAVTAAQVVDLINRTLGDWTNPRQQPVPALPAVKPPDAIRRVSVPVPGKTQSDIMLGVVGPARLDPDHQAASLANSVLGQFGMMGRIGEAVREKSGMAYYAYSRLEGGLGPGSWYITAGVNPDNIERAVELCVGEIRRIMTELIDDSDLADNQSYYVKRLPLQLESNEGLCSTMLTMEIYNLGFDYILRYRDLINALTKEDLRAAVQHYWNPDAYVLTIAGSEPD
jgi:zinc protease